MTSRDSADFKGPKELCKQHRAGSLCNLPAHQGKVHEHVSVWLDRLLICYHNQIDKLDDKNKTN